MVTLLALLSMVHVATPSGPVKWSFGATANGEGSIRIDIRSQVEEGWHIYATKLPSDLGPVPTAIRFTASDAFTLEGELDEPEPVEVFDENFGMVVRYHNGSPAFAQRIKPMKPGPFEVSGKVEYMVCNDKTCLPPVVVPFTLRVESM